MKCHKHESLAAKYPESRWKAFVWISSIYPGKHLLLSSDYFLLLLLVTEMDVSAAGILLPSTRNKNFTLSTLSYLESEVTFMQAIKEQQSHAERLASAPPGE